MLFSIPRRHLRAVINESQNPLISFHIISGLLKSFSNKIWNHEGEPIIQTKPEHPDLGIIKRSEMWNRWGAPHWSMRPMAQVLFCFSDSDKGEEIRTRVTPFENADELGRGSSRGWQVRNTGGKNGNRVLYRIQNPNRRAKERGTASRKRSAGGRNRRKTGSRPGQPEEWQSGEEQASLESEGSGTRRRSGRAGRPGRVVTGGATEGPRSREAGSSLQQCKKPGCDRSGSVSSEFAKFLLKGAVDLTSLVS
jgi:hypothetical protein